MLDIIIALVSLAKDAYDVISDIRKVDQTPQVIKQLEALNTKFEKLGDHIYYVPTIQLVRDTTRNQQHVLTNLREVRQYLEPVQQAVGSDILSSAMILTPELMQQLMRKNPWQVLIDIRPANLTTPNSNPDMVPILFDHENMPYIGWQLRGTLPLLFNCQYDPNLHLLKSSAQTDVPSSNIDNVSQVRNKDARNIKYWSGFKALVGVVKELFSIKERGAIDDFNINLKDNLALGLKEDKEYVQEQIQEAQQRVVDERMDEILAAIEEEERREVLVQYHRYLEQNRPLVSLETIRQVASRVSEVKSDAYYEQRLREYEQLVRETDIKIIAEEQAQLETAQKVSSAKLITPDNLDSLHIVNEVASKSSTVDAFALSLDNSILALRYKNSIKIYNVENAQLICEVDHLQLQGCVFSPKSTFIATWANAQGEGVIHLWRVQDGSLVCTIRINNVQHIIDRVVYSPDEKFIVVGLHSKIQLYDISTGQFLRDLVGERRLVGFFPKLYISKESQPDNDLISLLVAGSSTVELWNITNGFELRQKVTIPSGGDVQALFFSPSTRYALAQYKRGEGYLYSIELDGWNRSNWEFVPHQLHCQLGKISHYAFPSSYDTNPIIAFISQGRAKIVRAGEPEELPSQSGEALTVAYSPDNKLLAVEFSDHCIRLYNSYNMALLRTLVENGTIICFTPNVLITGFPKVEGGYSEEWKLWKIA